MAGSILEYASQLFHEGLRRRLGHPSKSVLPPQSRTQEATSGSRELDVGFNELLRNVHSIIDQLVQSIQNPVQVDWDAAEYWNALIQYPREVDSPLESPIQMSRWKNHFPPKWENSRLVEEATLFVDQEGRILCWFIPNVLSLEIQNDFHKLESAFVDLLKRPGYRPNPCDTCNSRQWFLAEKYFAKYCMDLPPGVIDISPVLPFVRIPADDHEHEDIEDPPFHIVFDQERPNISTPALKRWNQVFAFDSFAKQRLERICAIPNVIFHLVHHELYVAAYDVRQKVLLNPRNLLDPTDQLADVLRAFSHWPTVFTTTTLTSNITSTPVHRPRSDVGFEVLVHTGGWNSELELPDIGARLKYDSGTIILLCGGLLQRSRKTFGEQVEWAFTVDEFLFKNVGLDMPRWSHAPTRFWKA